MFRSQLYNPLIDPARHEYYDEKKVSDDGYFIVVNEKEKLFSPGTKLWLIYNKSYFWHTIRSILCRALMIFYSFYLITETHQFLDESIVLFNLVYTLLILLDCLIVIFVREGLEDRWCSLSILFFTCANLTPLWILEIFYNSLLSSSIYNAEFNIHFDLHYKNFNSSILKLVYVDANSKIDLEKIWFDHLKKDNYSNLIGKYEVLFCVTLILCRLFMPQATLTWSAISTTCEFSFNTIFDVYSTMFLCRDSKLNLSNEIIIACFCVSNGALMSVSLNLFADSEKNEFEFRISLMRRLTDNLYFRLIVQIFFADLPFLILRLVIITKFQTEIKPDIYYLIAKQVIIILCKLLFMAYNLVNNLLDKYELDQVNRINSIEF